MKISLNWLKDYVTTGISTEKLRYKLTMAGLEVEKVSAGKGDTVFELEITPNRPDCLSMLGIAREAAAILNKTCRFPKVKKYMWPKKKCAIEIADKQGCSRYVGTLIEGVSIKKGQPKITKHLNAVGLHAINNVVDITNFCLMETGQPLHVFDYDKLVGGKIIVRRARAGEKIITIDDVERKLDPSVLVIADEKRPVAIAGIMGGKDTQVTAATKNILLESAHFDSVLIRRASRKIGLSSDSSYRFERGVDDNMVEGGASRAIGLILEDAKGKITKRSDVVASKKGSGKRRITISRDQINDYIGASLTAAQYKKTLEKLGCKVISSKTGVFKITPPSFREDIKWHEDIVEEVSRIIGYDNLPMSFPQVKTSTLVSDVKRDARKKVRSLFLAQGLDEVITYTMINRKHLQQSNQEDLCGVAIFNPLTQDQEIMRPSMLPSLLAIVLSNINRGQKNIKFFETGKVYTAKGGEDVLGVMMAGLQWDDWRRTEKKDVDFYDLKGALQQSFRRIGAAKKKMQFQSKQERFFAEGQSASVLMDGKKIGVAGKIAAEVLDNWDIKQKNIFFAQINIGNMIIQKVKPCKYEPISEFPAISRDISLAVRADVTAHDIEETIRKTVRANPQIALTGLKFVEKYEGEKISKEHRGLIFSLTYRSQLAKTLRDEEVAEIHAKVCDALVRDLGVIRR